MANVWALTREVATGTGGTAALTRTYTLTNGASVANGSLLVVKVGMVGGRLLATPYISSTSANITWTTPPPINANAGGTNGIALVYGRVTGSVLGTDTITLTFSGTAAPAIVVFEYSAGASISAVSTDKSASARAGASTAMNSGTTAALTNADDLVVGHCSFDNGTGTNLITPEVLSPAWTAPPTTTVQTIGSARDSLLWRDPQATTAVRFFGTISGANSDHTEGVLAVTATTSGGGVTVKKLAALGVG